MQLATDSAPDGVVPPASDAAGADQRFPIMIRTLEGVSEAFEVSDSDTVESLKEKIQERLGRDPMSQILVFRKRRLEDVSATMSALGIKDNSQIILLPDEQEHFVLDEAKAGDGVVLLGPGLVKNTTQHSTPYHAGSCRVILGKRPLPPGRHYFRVKLVEGEYYYIGVAKENVNLNTYLGAQSGGWSYYLRDNKGGSRLGPGYIDFDDRMYPGDTVTFGYDTEKGTLEIARNEGEFKLAREGLAGEELYLALGMGPNDVTLKLEAAWRDQ